MTGAQSATMVPRVGGRAAANVAGGTVAAMHSPDAPSLSITRSNAAVVVSWPFSAEGWVLNQTAALKNAPTATVWTQVAFPAQTNAARISITVPNPNDNRFYRLRGL